MDQKENITIDAEKIIPKKEKNFWRELVEIIFFVAIVVIPVQTFVGRTFIVVGSSMYPTFENKDYLIVDKLTYHFNDPKRGDVVVFHPPIDEKTYYIKRIIGLPKETVTVDGNKVIVKTVTGDEIVLDEPYRSSDGTSVKTLELAEDEYFVMGDNRAVSSDSRVWGALPESNISGRAFLRLFPFRSLDAWPGSLDEFNE